MRSIYWILACCLMFAAVMVMGLSMQSCRSKRAMEKSVHVDSVGMSACKEEMDSFAFRRLLERYNKNFSLEIRHYRPVKDSVGKVTHTYLDKQVWLQHRHEKEQDSSGWTFVDYQKGDTVAVRKSELTEEEPAPKARDNKIWFYLVLACLLYLWIKK